MQITPETDHRPPKYRIFASMKGEFSPISDWYGGFICLQLYLPNLLGSSRYADYAHEMCQRQVE